MALPPLFVCCNGSSLPLVVAEFARHLATANTGDHREAALVAATRVATDHGCPVPPAPEDVAALVWSVWDRVECEDKLDETITKYVQRGVDAEQLCFHVINRESQHHIGLIRKVAGKMRDSLSDDCRVEDLMTFGWLGLRTALRKFDLSLGYAFSTYACTKINGEIRDGVRREGHLPKRLTTVARAAREAQQKLAEDLQRPPSYAEIAAAMENGPQVLHLLPRLSGSASLDELAASWEGEAREPSCLIEDRDPADDALRNVMSSAVREAVSSLPADEGRAITLLFLEGLTLMQASEKSGVPDKDLRSAKRRGLAALAPKLQALAAEV